MPNLIDETQRFWWKIVRNLFLCFIVGTRMPKKNNFMQILCNTCWSRNFRKDILCHQHINDNKCTRIFVNDCTLYIFFTRNESENFYNLNRMSLVPMIITLPYHFILCNISLCNCELIDCKWRSGSWVSSDPFFHIDFCWLLMLILLILMILNNGFRWTWGLLRKQNRKMWRLWRIYHAEKLWLPQ